MPAANYLGDPSNNIMNWGMSPPPQTTVDTVTTATPWASQFSNNPLTNSPDYLQSLQSPDLAGVDLGGGMANIGGGSGHWWDGALGKTENGITTQGWAGPALSAAQGLMNGWMGMKQLNLAKATFDQNKKQFELNFGAQKKTTNAAFEDRQRARVASNPGAYQSVGDYMNKNGV